ncbi:MAG: C39 family peptidase [Candidatus Margulisiibacteriota bacterium]
MRILILAILFIQVCCQTVYSSNFGNVPFLCQAPEGRWIEPYEDGCEEAAIIMAVHWAKHTSFDKLSEKKEMLSLVAYQKEHYGGHYDLDTAKMLALMKDYYGFSSAAVKEISSPQDIEDELYKGHILIVPAAGRLLKNPYFTLPGPVYHCLVITGFDKSRQVFIVNDPGTRRGKNYKYPYSVLFNAIHDWTGAKNSLLQGHKKVIVVSGSK